MVQIKKEWFFFFIAFILACHTEEIQEPEHLLSREKMIHVLIDMHIMKAKTQRQALPSSEASLLYQRLLKKVYKKHQIDSLTFSESYGFYMEKMSDLKNIYSAALDSLIAMSQKKR